MKRLLLFTLALMLISGCESPADLTPELPPTESPMPTSTIDWVPTKTPAPTLTSTPTLIPSPTATATQVPKLTEWEILNLTQGMVKVPAGELLMGCNPGHNGGFTCPPDERPMHIIELGEYFIDKFEVTNAKYSECVKEGACSSPRKISSETRESYYDNPEYSNFPVINVSWSDANNYCTWLGKRLPTEAEWEKAARGTTFNTYAWGDDDPSCLVANIADVATAEECINDTNKVGSYPEANSPYGVSDLTGNVWEWVWDYYSETYYSETPSENPTGPASGSNKVLRGGSWANTWVFLRASSRSYDVSFNVSSDTGFRCAFSVSRE